MLVWEAVRGAVDVTGRKMSDQFMTVPSQFDVGGADYYARVAHPLDMTAVRDRIDNDLVRFPV